MNCLEVTDELSQALGNQLLDLSLATRDCDMDKPAEFASRDVPVLPILIRLFKSPALVRITKVVAQPQRRCKPLHFNAVEA